MKRKVQLDRQTLQSIESCRAGYDDLGDAAMSHVAAKIAADPELDKLFDRIQYLDAKIGAAFHDVAVPAGLDKRILEQLAHPQIDLDEEPAERRPTRSTACADTCFSSLARGRRVSRRSALAAAGLLCGAAALLAALWINLHDVEDYSEQAVLDEAIRLFDADLPGDGSTVAQRPAPKAYPLSRAILVSAGVKWREVRDFLGRAGVVYDLPVRNGARAALYVIEQRIEGLGNGPRHQPFTTGGYSASAWQEGRLLYVLVVQGQPQEFKRYIYTPRGPVA